MKVQEGRLYGSIVAAKEAGISLRQLYYWADVLRIVKPAIRQYGNRVFRRFTAEDIEALIEVRRFVESGYTLRAAAARLQQKQRSS